MRIHPVDLWITVAGLACAVFAVLTWGTLPLSEHSGEILATFGALTLLVAIFIRIWWAPSAGKRTPAPKLIWFLPAAMTAIVSPALIAQADERTPPLMAISLFVLLAYGCLALGILVLTFVVLPLEAIGRGILRVATGKPDGGWLIFVGSLGLIITAWAITGAFALDDLPPGRAGWLPIILALFGIPGAYTVASETLLWVTRGLGLLFFAMLFASAHFPRRRPGDRQTVSGAEDAPGAVA